MFKLLRSHFSAEFQHLESNQTCENTSNLKYKKNKNTLFFLIQENWSTPFWLFSASPASLRNNTQMGNSNLLELGKKIILNFLYIKFEVFSKIYNFSDSTFNLHVDMAIQGKKWSFFGEHKPQGSKFFETIHISLRVRHFTLHGFEKNRCYPIWPICIDLN